MAHELGRSGFCAQESPPPSFRRLPAPPACTPTSLRPAVPSKFDAPLRPPVAPVRLALAGWLNRRQAAAVESLREEKPAAIRVGLMAMIGALAVRFAQDNPTWSYDPIQGALKNDGPVVAPNTVQKALKAAGLDPAPDRGKRTPWRTFLKAQAVAIAAKTGRGRTKSD